MASCADSIFGQDAIFFEDNMKNILLGAWVVLLSITSITDIVFPFQGGILVVLGLASGGLHIVDGFRKNEHEQRTNPL